MQQNNPPPHMLRGFETECCSAFLLGSLPFYGFQSPLQAGIAVPMGGFRKSSHQLPNPVRPESMFGLLHVSRTPKEVVEACLIFTKPEISKSVNTELELTNKLVLKHFQPFGG